jgi:hypothetical protein
MEILIGMVLLGVVAANARLFSIVGAAILQHAAQNPAFDRVLRDVLQAVVTDGGERNFLKARGWLASQGDGVEGELWNG